MDQDVAQLAREERVVEAAELAASRGDARTACDLFERACAWDRASAQAAIAGDDARALSLAVLGGDEAQARALECVTRVAASKSATDAAHATLVSRGEHAWAARLLEAAGRLADAAHAWDRAGDAVRAAKLLERAGDVIGAARALESAARREPKNDDVSLALGELLLRFGKTEEAVRALQRIATDAPERRRALTLLARAFDALGLARAKVDADAELAALGGPDVSRSPSVAPGAPVRARIFGRYEVVREVASSASARVVECTDAVRGEHVAVKIFAGYDQTSRGGPQNDARGAGRDALARFEREVRVLAQLSHPNVVPLRDYVADGPAIVLAWMSGGTLDARLGNEALTPARANEIACAVLSALGEAHRLGVIHRDVKPANVLFDDAGVARLSDFGVAHLGDLSATATAGVIGTLAYMSPEQREGRPATVQSDVYAVGAILFEMLTGERLRSTDAVAARPSGAHRDLDARHDDVVLRMIDPDPAARPIDAFAARRALLALPWPDAMEPAAPRPKPSAKSSHPQAGRADLLPDGTGFDRWIARPFEHAPLDERSLARASAFARASHPALQTILRIDREASRIWIERLAGRALDGPLTRAQATSLEQALTALHAAGIAHGHVDRAHVTLAENGAAVLRFTPSCAPTSTVDRDRLALARLEA
jgi:tRNA A-37 threonylcarbamoyl transferase component Bud32